MEALMCTSAVDIGGQPLAPAARIEMDDERAGRALVTLIVDDIDAWTAQARQRGVATPVLEATSALRRTTFNDLDGTG